MPAFCTETDVREAMQERNSSGTLQDSYVAPAVQAASRWVRNETGAFFYDSGNTLSGNTVSIATSARTTTVDSLDVPSSPHQQERQLVGSTADNPYMRYPVARVGRYAKVRLPHRFVDTVSKLTVRGFRGGVEDWVAASDKQEGRDAEYYVKAQGVTAHGDSHLYISADAIGPRENFTDLIDITYDYGLDYATEPWDDIRRGTALLAAAQMTTDHDLLTSIPEQGTLVGVDTTRDAYLQDALTEAQSLLGPWLQLEVA